MAAISAHSTSTTPVPSPCSNSCPQLVSTAMHEKFLLVDSCAHVPSEACNYVLLMVAVPFLPGLIKVIPALHTPATSTCDCSRVRDAPPPLFNGIRLIVDWLSRRGTTFFLHSLLHCLCLAGDERARAPPDTMTPTLLDRVARERNQSPSASLSSSSGIALKDWGGGAREELVCGCIWQWCWLSCVWRHLIAAQLPLCGRYLGRDAFILGRRGGLMGA